MSEVGPAGEDVYLGPAVTQALAEASTARHSDQTPAQWIKANLFSNPLNGIITIVFGLIGAYLAYRTALFVFATARWEPVRENLELFMIGLLPRSERTRLIVQLLMMSGGAGMIAGFLRQRALLQAELAGVEPATSSPRELVGTYWALIAFFAVSLAIGARTINPYLLLLGCLVCAASGFAVTLRTKNPLPRLVVLVPLVVAGIVLTRTADLNNGAAYGIAIGAVIIAAVVNVAHRPAVTLSGGLLLGVMAFQAMSGTDGLAWVYLTLALLPAAFDLIGEASDRLPAASGFIGAAVFVAGGLLYGAMAGINVARILILLAIFGVAVSAVTSARAGDPATGTRLGLFTVIGFVTWQAGRAAGVSSLQWTDWGGFHLNVVVAAGAIVLAFPIGLLLALGRRSSLPVLRWLCTGYIELIRGVPLISLLFMAQLFVGFLLSSGGDNFLLTTKGLIVITMFSSAYIAEIVRGGLQAVAKGQTEAGQAMGMSPAAITRLLVLPQALRAVIPAMVGQFISLWKDTSLLTFITVLEFLGVREIIHSQEAFRGFGIAETLVFVAFGYWAVSYAMSRESQRLERRLNVSN